MEKKDKTVWKKKMKKEFSESPNIDETFQTLHMIQKIKQSKKSKETKENYKNIKPLQNIYDEPKEEESLSESKTDSPSESTPEIKKEGFTDDQYDGIEPPDPTAKADNPKIAIVRFIDSMFNYIKKFNRKQAQLIADVFSHKTATKQDVSLLQYYIALFETIGVSYYVAYNWFFYLFYDVKFDPFAKEDSPEIELPKQVEVSQKAIIEASRKWQIIDIYLWFGEFIAIYPEYFQCFMVTIIPFFFSMFNYKVCFIFLFLLFIYIIFNLMTGMRNVIVDALNMNTSNRIVIIMFMLFFLLYFPSPWFPAKSDNAGDQASSAGIQNIVFSSVMILIPFVMYRCVRAFFVILLTVPLGALALALYILFYSFFGVSFYYYFNPFKTVELFNNMYIFIKNGKKHLYTMEQHEHLNFIQKFIIIMNNFFESLHRYILYIVYIIMILVAAVDYYNLIGSPTLKTNMLIISFVFFMIFASFTAAEFMKHAYNDTTS